MEKFEPRNVQEKMDKGENVKIRAIFVRHGEKEHDSENPETGLTLDGEWGARELGQGLGKKDMIKSYASDTNRTWDAAKYITEQSPTLKKGNQRLKKQLAFHYDRHGEFLKNVLKIKNDILKEKDGLSKEKFNELLHEATTKQIDYYLSFGNNRPDTKTYSPKETAADMARLLDEHVKMSKKLKSGSEIDIINVTHDFNLAAFLKEILVREEGGKKVIGFDSIEEIGGGLDFNEGFEVLIETDKDKNKKIKLLFRKKEYEIDEAKFKELTRISTALDYE